MPDTVILGTARTLGGGLASHQHVVVGQMLQAGQGGYGCAAICSGGGQGDAVIIKV